MTIGIEVGPTHRRTTAFTLAALLFVLAASAAQATEAEGHITIGRDLPAHNPFRPIGPGKASQVATAPEGIPVAGARLQSAPVSSLPDSALEAIGAQVRADTGMPGNAGGASLASTTAARSAGPVGTVVVQGTAPIVPAAMGAVPAGATARSLAPIGSAFASMPGLK